MCAAMNYDTYSFERMEETRQRMRHAISLTQQQLNPSVAMPPLMHHRSVLPVTSHHHASADHKHRTQPHYLHPVPPPPPPPMSVMHPTAPIYLPPKKHSPVLLIPPTSSEAPKRRRYPVRPPTPFHTSTQTLPPIYMQQSHMPALRAF
ncbi:hypothetical protein QCA50_017957 [Cerrena zonata]|uniref:Uncharacterized protein n=1 Tax=Cerrena zonata TaxID=2478898 RepID=A0AAW0FC05_9APHY